MADKSSEGRVAERANERFGFDLDREELTSYLNRTTQFDPSEATPQKALQLAKKHLEHGAIFDAADILRLLVVRSALDSGLERSFLDKHKDKIISVSVSLVQGLYEDSSSLDAGNYGWDILNQWITLAKKSDFLDKDIDSGVYLSRLNSVKREEYVDFVTNLLGLSRDQAAAHFNSLLSTVAGASPLGRYADNKDQFPDPLTFLKQAYEGRLGLEGDLDQSTLRSIDPTLMRALDLVFTGERREELRKLLPTKKERVDARLMKALGYVPTGQERKSAVTVMARGQTPKPKG